MTFEWNQPEKLTREFWDTDANAPKFSENYHSLKYRLENPGSVRIEEHIADIGKGLAQVMNYIEQKENK